MNVRVARLVRLCALRVPTSPHRTLGEPEPTQLQVEREDVEVVEAGVLKSRRARLDRCHRTTTPLTLCALTVANALLSGALPLLSRAIERQATRTDEVDPSMRVREL